MEKRHTFTVSSVDAGFRLDKYLASSQVGLTRSRVENLIESGNVKVNDRESKPGYKIKSGDVISLQEPELLAMQAIPQDIPVNIVYQDEWLLIVDKPAGLVVHPAPGNLEGTLVNALLFHCQNLSGIGGLERPGIVHRLDKETSGLLMVAKNDLAHASLTKQLQSRKVKRSYLAICLGIMKQDAGKIDAAIGRHPIDRKKLSTVTRKGREAITEFRVLERFEGSSLLELKLGTGRTHQIRVHLASLSHPVLGDSQYGGKRRSGTGRKELAAMAIMRRQALHAQVLGFIHPENSQYLEFYSPLPQDMQEALRVLRS